MSIGYYVRPFPAGCSGVGVIRNDTHTVIVVDKALTARQGVKEALKLLTDEEIREWLDL